MLTQTTEEKALASVSKRIRTLEDRVKEYNEVVARLTAEGRDYIARKVIEDIRAYDAAAYYADVTDKFITVLEAHKIHPAPELIMKLLECASYSKWIAERQAGELAKEEERTKRRL